MKKFIICIILCTAPLFTTAAQDIKNIFINMPDSLAPLLSKDNRADCVDFLKSKMKAEVENKLKSKSEMTEMTSNYIQIRMSPNSIWQMKLLPTSKDTIKIVCVVTTVCAPVCDSQIHFYTSNWTPLETKEFIKLPKADDFFIAPKSTDPTDSLFHQYSVSRNLADVFFMKADLDKIENTLTFSYTTPDFMQKEDAEKMKGFLRNPIIFKWGKGKFVN
jgi:hypothetical protein